jgi:hypothetical protein
MNECNAYHIYITWMADSEIFELDHTNKPCPKCHGGDISLDDPVETMAS